MYTRRSDGSIDPRMDHQGCPVLYGNKWIANKWIRWTEQVESKNLKVKNLWPPPKYQG